MFCEYLFKYFFFVMWFIYDSVFIMMIDFLVIMWYYYRGSICKVFKCWNCLDFNFVFFDNFDIVFKWYDNFVFYGCYVFWSWVCGDSVK